MTSANHRRTSSAVIVMALVAIAGAVAAFCAARAEQNALGIERRLEQGKILELARREEVLRTMTYASRYEDRRAQLDAELKNIAIDLRNTPEFDVQRRAQLRLELQENEAMRRVLRPVLRFFRDPLGAGSLETALSRDAAEDLIRFGFDTDFVEPKGDQPPSSIWHRLEAAAQHEHSTVQWLAAAVLFFVVSLALFTFALLNERKPARERTLKRSAVLLAVAALLIVLIVDHAAWKTYLMYGLLFAVVAPIGQLIARWLRLAETTVEEGVPLPAELEPTLFPGMRMHLSHITHRMGRFSVAMIALAAVLSALAGFFYSRESAASAASASEALDHQAVFFKAAARRGTSMFYEVGRMTTLLEDRLRIDIDEQRLALSSMGATGLNQRDAAERLQEAERRMNDDVGSHSEELETFRGAKGPDRDALFPKKLVSEFVVPESAEAFARWDALSERSLQSQTRATIYLEMLTILAVALYLFGQALSLGTTRSGFILVFVACWLVGLGVVRFGMAMRPAGPTRQAESAACRGSAARDAHEDPIDASARHFGRGRMLFETGDYSRAVSSFQCAVEIRPTFALAHFYLARSMSLASTPQLDEGGFVSVMSKESLPRITDHEQRALSIFEEQGFLAPPLLEANYGFDLFLRALLESDSVALDRALEATRRVIARDDTDLVTRFNLAVGLLATRKRPEAQRTYDEGIALGMKDKVATMAGAITDLYLFREHCKPLNPADYCAAIDAEVERAKLKLIAATWPSPTTRGLSRIESVRLYTEPAGLGWTATFLNMSANDVVAVLWYAFDENWKTWRVLPAMSGTTTQRSEDFSSYLAASTPQCVRDGQYRAEFFVNGQLAAKSGDIAVTHGPFEPAVFDDLKLQLCHPAAWQRGDTQTGLIRGFTDNPKGSGQRGMYVVTYFGEADADGSDTVKRRSLDRAMHQVFDRDTADRTRFQPITRCAGYSGYRDNLLLESSDPVRNGAIFARAWTTSDGLAHVGIVFDWTLNPWRAAGDPAARHAIAEDCGALVSITNVR